jgi:predicted metal-dependent hydrolase
LKELEDAIILDGCMVPYTVRYSNRARHLRLEVHWETSALRVIVPEAFQLSQLPEILKAKKKWIIKKRAQAALFKKETEAAHQQGYAIFYRGRRFTVETRVALVARSEVIVEEDRLVVVVPPAFEGKTPEVLEGWLRQMARLIINQRIRVMNAAFKQPFNRVFIKGQKTRWGSCSKQRNLSFNWRLVMAPLPVIDYVVAHELAHLVEMNHSRKFWALVEQIYPGYSLHRAWLKENGRLLTL